MTEEREDAAATAAMPTWNDFQRSERIAQVVAWVMMIGGILAGPHLLCFLAGRPTSDSISTFFFDAVVVELLGMTLLVLLPLKVALKGWLYGKPGEAPKAPTPLKWAVAILWVVVTLGLTVLLIPQGFFALTGRATASFSSATGWLSDSLAAMVALLPQLIGMIPYVWSMRRAWHRMQEEVEGDAALPTSTPA